jgi:hypothetical protein
VILGNIGVILGDIGQYWGDIGQYWMILGMGDIEHYWDNIRVILGLYHQPTFLGEVKGLKSSIVLVDQ